MKCKQQQSAVDTFRTEVEIFEERLRHFRCDVPPGVENDAAQTNYPSRPNNEFQSRDAKRFIVLKSSMDPLNHMKMLSRTLPSIENMSKQSNDYLEKLRLRKIEDAISKRERDQRRRKRTLEEHQAQETSDLAQLEEMALSKLLRQSKQERRIAEQLMHVRHEREVMQENRIFREHQYSNRRQEDYENSLAREYTLCERAREEYRMQTAMQLAQHQEILAEKAAENHNKRYRVCLDIVKDIVDLSMRISEYRTLNDGKDLPRKLVDEWKLLFANGASMDQQYNPELTSDVVDSALYDRDLVGDGDRSEGPREGRTISNSIKLLDEKEFHDYLLGKGDWGFPGDSPLEFSPNELLAKLVDTLLDMTAPPEPVREAVFLPPVPLKIALIGKPFAGKKTLAKKLAAKYCLSVLSVDELVQDAIRHADITYKPSDGEKPRSKGATKAQIGAKIQINMLEGGSPDDVLLVSLVIEAIRRNTHDNKPYPYGGFILTDFPRTRTQAQLLERELSGYEDPKPVKLGNLKRTPKDKSRQRSQIVPLEGQPENKASNVTSGIDIVILLDVENDMACKRAAGRRIDPLTGEMYHLETNPPPVDDPGLLERLCPINEDESESNQIQYQIAAFEDQQDLLKEWYARFNNLQGVDGNVTASDVCTTVDQIIQELIVRKEKCKDQAGKDTLEGVERLLESPIHELDKPSDDGATTSRQLAVPVVDERVNITHRAQASPVVNNTDIRPVLGKVQEDDRKGKITSGRARGTSGSGKGQEKATSRTASAGAGVAIDATNGLKGRGNASAKERAQIDIKRDKGASASAGTGGERQIVGSTDPGVAAGSVDLTVESTTPLLNRPLAPDGKRWPSRDLAEVLADQWATIENTYTDTLKFAFRSLRREKEAILTYFHGIKVNFKRFLERPDQKQHLIELFQHEFNNVEDDLRSDSDAKAELHQRAEDLRERLWEMSDKRKEEAETERMSIIEDKWVEDHFIIMANVYITMMQVEVDRHLGTKHLIADYFRDAQGAVVPDNIRSHVKIPLISTSASASLDIGSLFVNTSADSMQKLHKRDLGGSAEQTRLTVPSITRAGGKSGSANPSGASGGLNAGGGKKPPAVARMASVMEIPRHTAGAGGDKDQSTGENEHAMFSDIQAACDAALSVLVSHEETPSPEKEKKDKKKPSQIEPVEQKAEAEVELPVDYHKIVEREDHALRRKIDRLKQHAMDSLRELRNKAIDVYTSLDDWIGARFAAEMDAIREMLNVIKEAVEAESKLPNLLILQGERFKVDFQVLTYEPEPEPRPPSPLEKPLPDQFTVSQLVNLCRQFRNIAPSGYISCKEFLDYFQKMASVSSGTEQLPEHYNAAEPAQLQQLCLSLDPYETGFISWRKFLIINSRILPVPSIDQLMYLKNSYKDESINAEGWKISRSDYMRIPLWFEDEVDDSALQDDFSAKFNRRTKLKEALFYFFEAPEDDLHENIFDSFRFLMSSCLDISAKTGLQKAFAVMSDHEDGACSLPQVYEILHFGTTLLGETHRLGEQNIHDPFPKELLQRIFDEAGVGPEGVITFDALTAIAESQSALQSCVLYQLEDSSLLGIKSRPSSAIDTKAF
ncbi:adenylate kinase [Spizellomyces sp. 'palustris']|nr:adenylate kinase [Spizellomyces sp. 'palustris']